MKAAGWLAGLTLAAGLWGANCGGGCGGICGSVCDLMDCSFGQTKCLLYPAPQQAWVINYITMINDVDRTWTAQLAIELDGLQVQDGMLLETDEFMNRVHLTRPGEGEQWPEYDGKECQIDSAGDANEEKLSGECNFSFTNGRFGTFEFSCSLEQI